MTVEKGLVLLGFAAHATLLLCHRTGGGFQYGARYWMDCLPWAFLWMGLERRDDLPRMRKWTEGISLALLVVGLGMAAYGATVVLLPG
jgi:hypothetical protein